MRGTVRSGIALAIGLLVAWSAAAETVGFETEDGFSLTAELWRAKDPGAPVAILLHQLNQDRHSFGALQPALSAAGFTVLSLDQRGQGASTHRRTPEGEKTIRIRSLSRERAKELVRDGAKDVAAALAELSRLGLATSSVVLVGSSYGCTVALLAAEKDPRVRAVALLSPGADYFGVDVLGAARSFRGTLFAVAAEDDPVDSSPPGTRAIGAAHEGPEEIRILPRGGHGTALLEAEPKLAAETAALLAAAVHPPRGASTRTQPQRVQGPLPEETLRPPGPFGRAGVATPSG